jgi:hypothetical protein
MTTTLAAAAADIGEAVTLSSPACSFNSLHHPKQHLGYSIECYHTVTDTFT